jgi:hypothetical protein
MGPVKKWAGELFILLSGDIKKSWELHYLHGM